MFLHTHTHTHAYIYIYMRVCVSTCISVCGLTFVSVQWETWPQAVPRNFLLVSHRWLAPTTSRWARLVGGFSVYPSEKYMVNILLIMVNINGYYI